MQKSLKNVFFCTNFDVFFCNPLKNKQTNRKLIILSERRRVAATTLRFAPSLRG